MMQRGPLYDLQTQNGVSFVEVDGWELPSSYQLPADELAVLRDSIGLVDLSGWGVLRLQGSNRLDFVQRLSTNDVKGLANSHGAPTVFATPVGRIVDLALVLVRQDDVLLIVGRGANDRVAGWLRRHIFYGDDVVVEDLTAACGLIGVAGPGSQALVKTVFGEEAAELDHYHSYVGRSGSTDVTVIGSVPWICDFVLLTAADQAPVLWTALSSAVESAGGVCIGEYASETARIGAGWPRFGHELSDDYIPLEAGLKWAIDFDKGCYVGQEIIARMETYRKLAKRLVVLGRGAGEGSSVVTLLPDHEIRSGETKVGRITSVAPLPEDGMFKALAYVKTGAVEVGRKLLVAGLDDALELTILSVPGE
jgi:folate-binding protein YgfZ